MRRSFLPVLLLASVSFIASLGRGAIADSDEAFYAESSREMVESGDWLTPHFNYEPRFQKPILYYWLTAAAYEATGPTEFSARVWSALAGIGLVLLVTACGRRWFDETTGLLAGAIAATSFGYFALARMALPDLPLAFFTTLAIWAAFVATLERERHSRRWLLLAAAAAALGFLTKGPLALIIPALVVVPVLLIERRSFNIRIADVAVALLLFVGLAAPVVRGDVDDARRGVSARVFRRRQLRAVRDRALQRSAAVVVLSAGPGRRSAAVDAADARVAASDPSVPPAAS